MTGPYAVIGSSADREVWLQARREGIGASDIAAVMGLNPWRTAFQLFHEKINPKPDEDPSGPMKWGLKLEQPIGEAWGERFKVPVTLSGQLLRSAAHPWMLATLDFEAEHPEHGRIPVECKLVTDPRKRAEVEAGDIPPRFLAQIHQQMIVYGARHAGLAILYGGAWEHHFLIEANPAWEEQVIEMGREFWGRVQRLEPPEPTGADLDFLKEMYPADDGSEVELGVVAEGWFRELEEIPAQIKAAKREHVEPLEARKKHLEALVRRAMGEATRATLPSGRGFTLATTTRNGYTVESKTYRTLRRVKA